VSVVGVKGMGGAGKTTMAWALCNDKEIKGVFQLLKPFSFPNMHSVYSFTSCSSCSKSPIAC